MKKLRCILYLLILALPAISQADKGSIHLKNGTILKGKYQYSDDLQKIQVESAGNLWVFDVAEVDTVIGRRSAIQRTETVNPAIPAIFIKSEVGVLAGNSENSQGAPFSFTASLNYLINPQFSTGAGIGVEFLKESYLPVFARLEYKFRDASSTPYFFLKGGYQVPLEESREVYYDYYQPWSSVWPGPDYSHEKMKARGGILINPGIGYLRMYSSNFGLSFAFGYQYHRLHYSAEKDYALDIDFNRLTIKLGIIFN